MNTVIIEHFGLDGYIIEVVDGQHAVIHIPEPIQREDLGYYMELIYEQYGECEVDIK